jgi:hypothetical protein
MALDLYNISQIVYRTMVKNIVLKTNKNTKCNFSAQYYQQLFHALVMEQCPNAVLSNAYIWYMSYISQLFNTHTKSFNPELPTNTNITTTKLKLVFIPNKPLKIEPLSLRHSKRVKTAPVRLSYDGDFQVKNV